MEKYYLLDHDKYCYLIYISDFTQEQQTKINGIYDDLEEEELEEKGYKFKYFIVAPIINIISVIKDIHYFLKNEGFVQVS